MGRLRLLSPGWLVFGGYGRKCLLESEMYNKVNQIHTGYQG